MHNPDSRLPINVFKDETESTTELDKIDVTFSRTTAIIRQKTTKKEILISKTSLLLIYNYLPTPFTIKDIDKIIEEGGIEIDGSKKSASHLIIWFYIEYLSNYCFMVSKRKDKIEVTKN